jgi:hypothetical protein
MYNVQKYNVCTLGTLENRIVTGGWRDLHDDKIYNFHPSQIVLLNEIKNDKREGHLIGLGETRHNFIHEACMKEAK